MIWLCAVKMLEITGFSPHQKHLYHISPGELVVIFVYNYKTFIFDRILVYKYVKNGTFIHVLKSVSESVDFYMDKSRAFVILQSFGVFLCAKRPFARYFVFFDFVCNGAHEYTRFHWGWKKFEFVKRKKSPHQINTITFALQKRRIFCCGCAFELVFC